MYWSLIKLTCRVIISIVLLLLPIDFFDTGDSICLSVVFFDTECYACGMTSAFMHFLNGDFESAFAYNMLIFIVFPLIAMLWIVEAYKEIKVIRKNIYK
ncbi:DUF2752 domain-containing protein [Hugenholtzia roseola]|uniref:DUF2752 domain-containing protein n=1 Tax=Hugenholtzia roseola TaxID=1002 RepID=UPI00054E4895|nr:DUF2752 domain-containing protein [Hugenholtzia roseola]